MPSDDPRRTLPLGHAYEPHPDSTYYGPSACNYRVSVSGDRVNYCGQPKSAHGESGAQEPAPQQTYEFGRIEGEGVRANEPERAHAERIVAAAIRQDGVVYTGPHHHQIIRYMVPLLGLKTVTGEQGFLTSRNRFVVRALAALIAYETGQVESEQETLFSEQLWTVRDEVFVGEKREPERAPSAESAEEFANRIAPTVHESEDLRHVTAEIHRIILRETKARDSAIREEARREYVGLEKRPCGHVSYLDGNDECATCANLREIEAQGREIEELERKVKEARCEQQERIAELERNYETEKTMHQAWRKRAEEAEARESAREGGAGGLREAHAGGSDSELVGGSSQAESVEVLRARREQRAEDAKRLRPILGSVQTMVQKREALCRADKPHSHGHLRELQALLKELDNAHAGILSESGE